MIRAIATISAGQAKNYFTDALQPNGYYINDQELPGRFYGQLADRLGITGPTDKDTFFALCDNTHPVTGENLTPRNKETRIVAWDISFHVPKSASILHVLSSDDHILKAFREATRETMKEMERDLMTRVRKNGRNEDRYTGEMVIAEFIHQTARPAKGELSDPHLHCHNIVTNVTWDDKEQRYKAGQFREINRSMPYYQARYHKRFADKLMGLGYKIRKSRTAFEIEGIPDHIISLFSKRTNEIGQFAKEHGITDEKELDQLGARTRGKKQKDMSMAELKVEWRKQIREASKGKEDIGDTIIRHKEKIMSPALPAQLCVDFAAKHRFERVSTISDRRLLESAYRYAVGNNSVSIEEITKAFDQDQNFIRVKEGYQTICTTKEVLAEEREMVMLARNGQGKLKPLYATAPDIKLEGQPKTAIENVLTTTNLVSIISGAAGSGKTTTLTELDRHFKAAGKEAMYVAPTAQAVREVLVKEGFTNAETVARLLVDPDLQNRLQNQILVVDEAGLIGTRDMRDLIALATRKQAQLILVGDSRQHSSVVRGDALRVLATVGKIKPAQISKIRRQRNEKYRFAVEDLSKGDMKAAFGKLADIEAIREIDPLNPNAELVADYVATIKRGKSALIVSPTHQQGKSVTEDVRRELQAAKLLGKKEAAAVKLSSLNLTEAQKGDWRNFRSGQVIQFNLPAPQIKRGSVWTIDDVQNCKVSLISKDGERKILPLDKAKAFDLYERTSIPLAKGDKIRITKGGFDQKDKRLNNGQMLEVVSSNKTSIKLRNRESKSTYSLPSDFGHIDHAYCTTSHSSQGKTCDEVFISQPAGTFPATDAKQFYVSVSRGRDMVTIYTDDKEQLLEYAERSGERQSALELLAKARTTQHRSPQPPRTRAAEKLATPTEEKTFNRSTRHLDYEP
ncbi:MobF family relaxase [Hufsiella ginkgonis]|uniref:Relaxase domain-containing protein n=1 Tax=Hufsiella ginkgonis TaxID=2695274 RepID=A0A7K1Y0X3_9SPHI|nr:MobF family relaxase [Hufsiella ginkgonis]MXV16900.1 relaxase domain-containing protein [Hufsiella ginkgonis]